MPRPIEDIVGKRKEEMSEPVHSEPLSVASSRQGINDTSIDRFIQKEKEEIHEIDSELERNPFLMRYANHATVDRDAETAVGRSFMKRRRTHAHRGGRGWKRIALIVLVAGFVVYGAFSFAFGKAVVYVTPAHVTVPLGETYQAETSESAPLSFETMVIDGSKSEEVPASGSMTGDIAATGSVILYNGYSSSSQNLLINTRLEDAEGRIYMTDKAVSVPGFTKKGTEIVPGQIEVGIHAEKGGDTYNQGPTDFVIFGFKSNKQKSEQFYARSSTSLTGGSTGSVSTITKSEYDAHVASLTEALKADLLTRVNAELPEGYFTFPDALFYGTTKLSTDLSSKEETIPLSLDMRVTAFMFPKSAFVDAIRARHSDVVPSDVPFSLTDPDMLAFSIEGKNAINPTTANVVTFSATGDATLVGEYDPKALVGALIGIKKKEVATILPAFPSLVNLRVEMTPLWRTAFPDKPDAIILKEEIKEIGE